MVSEASFTINPGSSLELPGELPALESQSGDAETSSPLSNDSETEHSGREESDSSPPSSPIDIPPDAGQLSFDANDFLRKIFDYS